MSKQIKSEIMEQTKKIHWKQMRNPTYLGGFDFEPKEERILTIKTVTSKVIVGEGGKSEDCIIIDFEEGGKPIICSNKNSKRITQLLGSPFPVDWIGKQIILYTEREKNFGELMDVLRVKMQLPKSKTLPDLTPAHPKWSDAVAAVQKGSDPELFRKHYTISAEVMDELISHIKL